MRWIWKPHWEPGAVRDGKRKHNSCFLYFWGPQPLSPSCAFSLLPHTDPPSFLPTSALCLPGDSPTRTSLKLLTHPPPPAATCFSFCTSCSRGSLHSDTGFCNLKTTAVSLQALKAGPGLGVTQQSCVPKSDDSGPQGGLSAWGCANETALHRCLLFCQVFLEDVTHYIPQQSPNEDPWEKPPSGWIELDLLSLCRASSCTVT